MEDHVPFMVYAKNDNSCVKILASLIDHRHVSVRASDSEARFILVGEGGRY